MQFGRYYEDFEVGATYRHWPGKTITEADDHLFCLITMNHHPAAPRRPLRAETTQFGRNVVVGNLVYSLALGMSVADVSGKAIANLEIESLRHENPTFHGDTIYAETTVLDKRESSSKPDRGIVTVETRAYNQRGEQVCVFRRRVLVPTRAGQPASCSRRPATTRPAARSEPGARPATRRSGGGDGRRMTAPPGAAELARYAVRPLLPGPLDALREAVLRLGGGAHLLPALARHGAAEALAIRGLTPDQTRVLERELGARGGAVLTSPEADRVVLLGSVLAIGELAGALQAWGRGTEALGSAISAAMVGRGAAPPPVRAGGHLLEFGRRTHVMGIVNVTPDSFSGDGLADDLDAAVALGEAMAAAGASVVDVGGESTRPGSTRRGRGGRARAGGAGRPPARGLHPHPGEHRHPQGGGGASRGGGGGHGGQRRVGAAGGSGDGRGAR